MREKVIKVEILLCRARNSLVHRGNGCELTAVQNSQVTLVLPQWHWNWVLFIFAAWITVLIGQDWSVFPASGFKWNLRRQNNSENDWGRGQESRFRYSCFCFNKYVDRVSRRLYASYPHNNCYSLEHSRRLVLCTACTEKYYDNIFIYFAIQHTQCWLKLRTVWEKLCCLSIFYNTHTCIQTIVTSLNLGVILR